MPALREAKRAYREALQREQAIAKALGRMQASLRKKANVVGYGVGHKKKGRKTLPELAAVFFVTRKIPVGKLLPADRLPASIRVGSKRVRTDVVGFPRFEFTADPAANRKRYRNPIQMGAQIGICHEKVDDEFKWGTAGAVVYSIANPSEKLMLSAGHVLHLDRLDVIQPSTATEHAHNRTFQSMPDRKDNVGTTRQIAAGAIDAGLAEIDGSTPEIVGIGAPGTPEGPVLDLPVQKSGAKTGVTTGTISHDNVVVFKNLAEWMWLNAPEIFYGAPPVPGKALGSKQNAKMKGLFIVTPKDFGDKGDSGSLIIVGPKKAIEDYVDKKWKKLSDSTRDALKATLSQRAVGLLIGVGAQQGAVGQQIQLALDALKVRLVT
jgi:hypothetical protein